jgi:D-aminopeptidase
VTTERRPPFSVVSTRQREDADLLILDAKWPAIRDGLGHLQDIMLVHPRRAEALLRAIARTAVDCRTAARTTTADPRLVKIRRAKPAKAGTSALLIYAHKPLR